MKKKKASILLKIKAFFNCFFFHRAVRTGLEPATPCVTGMYSNQLNYRTISLFRCYLSRLRLQRYDYF